LLRTFDQNRRRVDASASTELRSSSAFHGLSAATRRDLRWIVCSLRLRSIRERNSTCQNVFKIASRRPSCDTRRGCSLSHSAPLAYYQQLYLSVRPSPGCVEIVYVDVESAVARFPFGGRRRRCGAAWNAVAGPRPGGHDRSDTGDRLAFSARHRELADHDNDHTAGHAAVRRSGIGTIVSVLCEVDLAQLHTARLDGTDCVHGLGGRESQWPVAHRRLHSDVA